MIDLKVTLQIMHLKTLFAIDNSNMCFPMRVKTSFTKQLLAVQTNQNPRSIMQCDQSTDTNLCVSVCCFPPWHQRESIDFPSCIIHKNAKQLKPKRTTPKLFFLIKYARIPRRYCHGNHDYVTFSEFQ